MLNRILIIAIASLAIVCIALVTIICKQYIDTRVASLNERTTITNVSMRAALRGVCRDSGIPVQDCQP